ncbi:ATP-binding cassette domain-containing protein [Lactovum odontotermitis]
MINIQELQVNFGNFRALDIHQSITINQGDRIGIIGSNGAGKSTLVKSILGLTHYQGKIESDISHQQMAVHMQENHYVKTVSVKNIIQAILNTSIKTDKKLQELIQFFEFENCLNKRFQHLSGGQKQRLTIILILMQDAPLTFFDEVTSGLDFETRTKLMKKIAAWYEGKDASICLVSHYYDELEALTDKLLILEQGQLVDFGETQVLFEKYCGRVVLTIEDNQANQALTAKWKRLTAPDGVIALTCKDNEEELQLVRLLSENNINYRRSNFDIEILFTNAIAQFNENKENGVPTHE